MNNHWDKLSKNFESNKNIREIPANAADNILIAWPVILKFIRKYYSPDNKIKVLDFGCGGGGFVNKLHSLGFQATGVDSSAEMIISAKTAFPELSFLQHQNNDLSKHGKYEIITSIMTFQFISNIERTIKGLCQHLERGGLFVFAVHNPKHVVDCLKAGCIFEGFDSLENPKKGLINISGNRIPIFIRSANDYNKILKKLGLRMLIEKYPPFTRDFLSQFPVTRPVNESEYLIMGFRK